MNVHRAETWEGRRQPWPEWAYWDFHYLEVGSSQLAHMLLVKPETGHVYNNFWQPELPGWSRRRMRLSIEETLETVGGLKELEAGFGNLQRLRIN